MNETIKIGLRTDGFSGASLFHSGLPGAYLTLGKLLILCKI